MTNSPSPGSHHKRLMMTSSQVIVFSINVMTDSASHSLRGRCRKGTEGQKYSRGRSARGNEGGSSPFSRARASRLRIITPFSSPFGAYSAGYASQDYAHPDDHTLPTYKFHIRLLFTPENKN